MVKGDLRISAGAFIKMEFMEEILLNLWKKGWNKWPGEDNFQIHSNPNQSMILNHADKAKKHINDHKDFLLNSASASTSTL